MVKKYQLHLMSRPWSRARGWSFSNSTLPRWAPSCSAFTATPQQSSIYWQGEEYSLRPIQAEGFEMTGQGAQPMPTLFVGNVGWFITALVLYVEDLVGAKLIRHRTWASIWTASRRRIRKRTCHRTSGMSSARPPRTTK